MEIISSLSANPPTWQELMMIEPENVTFGQYKITSCQEDILTLVSEKLHDFIARNEVPPVDQMHFPYIELQCKDLNGKNNKESVMKGLWDMRQKTFKFHWIHPTTDEIIEVSGDFFPTVMNIKNTDRIALTVNPWALPFLLYYGVGQDGDRYSIKTALSLKGNYTKRLYKIICSQKEKTDFVYPIDRFREDLEIPKTYTNSHIKEKILKPIQENIRISSSEVWFHFELMCLNPVEGKKPKADTIVFHIHTDLQEADEVGTFQKYCFVHRWIQNTGCNFSTVKAQTIVSDIHKLGKLDEVYNKCKEANMKARSGELSMQMAVEGFIDFLHENIGVNIK